MLVMAFSFLLLVIIQRIRKNLRTAATFAIRIVHFCMMQATSHFKLLFKIKGLT
jgi:HKD family nuclease